MSLPQWLRQIAQRCYPRGGNRPRRAGRVPVPTLRCVLPCLEALEDRTLPAAVYLVGPPPTNFSFATAINASDEVVGEAKTTSGYHAAVFRYIGNIGSVTDLGTLPGTEYGGSIAYGINDSGQVVGQSYTAGIDGGLDEVEHAFLWSNGVMKDLGALPGGTDFSSAQGINDSGEVVGYSGSNTANHADHAILWSNGVMTDLGTLTAGGFSQATAINDSGQIVGAAAIADGHYHAFLYSNGAMTDLGTLPGTVSSYATGINASGEVVGYALTSTGVQHAFLYKNGAMTDLSTIGALGNLSANSDSVATGINASGQVTGYWRDSSGIGEAFEYYSDGSLDDLDGRNLDNNGPSWELTGTGGINDRGDIVGGGDLFGSNCAFLYSEQPWALVITAQPTPPFKAGQPFDLKVSVEDPGGAVDLYPSLTGNVNLTLVSNPGNSTFGGTRSAPLVDGVADFGDLTLDKPGQGYTLVATTSDGEEVPTTFVFDVSGPQVTPASMSWDSTQGGLNYGYTVNGATPLSQDVPAALYWSKSTSFSDNLGKIDGTDYTIPAGTAGNASYNQHVDGTLLRNAPQGTNYLLVVIGDPKSSDFDPSKDVYALQDVQVRGPASSPYPLSSTSIGEIKNLLRESGNSSATITSTVRTPYQQALAMYTNIILHGVASQLALYAAPGRAVIETYVDDVNAGITDPTTIINDMTAEVIAQGPYNVSHHCEDATEWAQLQVLDIAPSSLQNRALFAQYGNQDLADGHLSTFITPPTDPAFHLEIPQSAPQVESTLLSSPSNGEIKNVFPETGNSSATIASTVRTPNQQAVTKPTTVFSDIVGEIAAQGPYNVSQRSVDTTEWAHLTVLDIGKSSLKNQALTAQYGYQDKANRYSSHLFTAQMLPSESVDHLETYTEKLVKGI